DAVLASASQVVHTNIIQTILNFFRQRRPAAPVADKKEEPAQPDPAAGDAAPNAPEGEQATEEECKKVDVLTSSSAVAAN
ncbi:unnamed protein product, partial [Cylicostephanus goldi]